VLGVRLPERLEFGNGDHIRLAREAEEEAARRGAGLRRWRVHFSVVGCGSVEVDARSEEEARRLVEEGEVGVEPDGWEGLEVGFVDPVDPEREGPPPPEQVVFPFAEEGGGDASGGEV